MNLLDVFLFFLSYFCLFIKSLLITYYVPGTGDIKINKILSSPEEFHDLLETSNT